MIDALQNFTESLPPVLQWLGVMLIAAIPFVESYFGAAIGVLAGLHPVVAIAAAVVGNAASMLAFVFTAHAARRRVTRNREEPKVSPRRARLSRMFDRFGVPGVSILGQTVLPSQITSAAMVSFGASRNAVILWQLVSIVLWAVVFGVLATLGVQVLFR
jgi:CHASE2 domain-containing sensor protein